MPGSTAANTVRLEEMRQQLQKQTLTAIQLQCVKTYLVTLGVVLSQYNQLTLYYSVIGKLHARSQHLNFWAEEVFRRNIYARVLGATFFLVFVVLGAAAELPINLGTGS